MRTHFGDTLIADVEDTVTVLDGAQAVGNDDAGPALEHFPDAFLQKFLRLGVNGGSGFVQDQDGRIGQECAGKGDELLFSLAEVAAALLDFRLVMPTM